MTTRRNIIKAVAALSVAPAAAFARTDQTPENTSPDHDLLRLGAEFEKAWAIEKQESAIARQTHDWVEWHLAFENTDEIVDQIAPLPATTLAGLKVKARCIQWCHGDDPCEYNPHGMQDERLTSSIIADLLGGAS